MRKVILASFAMLCVVACDTDTSPWQKMTSLQQQAVKWRMLQHNYTAPNAKVGSDSEIGYVFGVSDDSRIVDATATAYFDQETKIDGKVATLVISAKESIGDCKNGAWVLIYNANNPASPSRAVVIGKYCESLYPDFCKLASSGKCGMEEILPPPEKCDMEEILPPPEPTGNPDAAKSEPDAAAKKLLKTGAKIPDTNPDAAKSELDAAAKKWQKTGAKIPDTKLFTFGVNHPDEGYYFLRATSKEKIGDCPAKSVWEIGYEGCDRWNKVPDKCKSITPKSISSYSGESPGC